MSGLSIALTVAVFSTIEGSNLDVRRRWSSLVSHPDDQRFEQRVNEALRSLGTVLNSTRHPQYPAHVPHQYDDKYLLAELATKAAGGALFHMLETLVPGLWQNHGENLLRWADGHRVYLQFWACQRCTFNRTSTREVKVGNEHIKETVDASGRISKETVKVQTTVEVHFWDMDGEWELSMESTLSGAKNATEHVRLQGGKSVTQVFTTTAPGADRQPPQPDNTCTPTMKVDVTWLLGRLQNSNVEFSINRSSSTCRTPRRNSEIDQAMDFFSRLHTWAEEILMRPWKHWTFNDEVIRDSFWNVFEPVLALFGLEENSLGPPVLTQDLGVVLQEYGRSLVKSFAYLQKNFISKDSLFTIDFARFFAALIQVQSLSEQHAAAVDALENLLHKQLVAAIGKHIGPLDFAEYMQFHNQQLFHGKYLPQSFCYAVRRPHHFPEGTVSLETETSTPMQTVVVQRNASQPMSFKLNAATEVSFLGERFLHAVVLHSFSSVKEQQAQLVARARQFSSFILLLGKVASADLFEPTAALIIKDKDEAIIPLLFEASIPTPKQFKAAVASLSPEQERFASAFRSLQLSNTLFGICIIQIKPHLERLLNLPEGALTKEIQLNRDLMELFIKYQVPSDLVSYDGDAAVNVGAKLQAVKEHVKMLMDTISAARKREVEEEEQKAQKRLMEQAQLRTDPVNLGSSHVNVGSSLSLRSFSRLGSSLSVLDFCCLGSSLSLRSFARLGSSLSVFGTARLGSASNDPEGSRHDPVHFKKRLLHEGRHAESQDESLEESTAADSAGDTNEKPRAIDLVEIPKLLDQRIEQLDEDSTLRSTIIKPQSNWRKKEQAGLVSEPKWRTLGSGDQRKEHDQAFDLLDALSRSGVLPLPHASLHVVVASTHCFDKTLINTVLQDNVNPIEKAERSSLIIASTIHGVPVPELVKDEHHDRIRDASPILFE